MYAWQNILFAICQPYYIISIQFSIFRKIHTASRHLILAVLLLSHVSLLCMWQTAWSWVSGSWKSRAFNAEKIFRFWAQYFLKSFKYTQTQQAIKYQHWNPSHIFCTFISFSCFRLVSIHYIELTYRKILVRRIL